MPNTFIINPNGQGKIQLFSRNGQGNKVVGSGGVITSSNGWLDNLPANMTQLVDINFNNVGDVNDWTGNGAAGGYTDATAPYSPDKVARFVFNSGSAAGMYGGARTDDSPDNTVRVYTSFNIKLSSNYTVHPANQKVVYLFRATDQSIGSMVLGIRPGAGDTNYTSGSLRWNMDTQTSDGVRYANATTPTLNRDTWYHIEMLATMNTVAGNSSGGVFQMWVDGVLAFNYTGVLFTDSADLMKWRDVAMDMYYGGNSPGHIIPSTCYIYVDHWTVYTSTSRS